MLDCPNPFKLNFSYLKAKEHNDNLQISIYTSLKDEFPDEDAHKLCTRSMPGQISTEYGTH